MATDFFGHLVIHPYLYSSSTIPVVGEGVRELRTSGVKPSLSLSRVWSLREIGIRDFAHFLFLSFVISCVGSLEVTAGS